MNYAAPTRFNQSRRGISKAVAVYDDLRGAIVSLDLAPGARIDKAEICERLGVSRQPLAEAIARLAEERLVEVEPQKGTFVARIRLADVVEAAFVRRAVEVATVEALAPRIDHGTLSRLERLLDYQALAVKAKDIDEFYALDVRFHAALFDGLAMRRAVEVVDACRAQLERARRLLLPTPTRNRNTLREHRAIFDALAEGSAARAAEAMGAHLDEGMSELRRYAAARPEMFEP
ncbi:MAG TPA: GntR family transcriptional regulator [Bauldia sp.]|nr:GntR family transcriptional regulator [Bauldia sp.]